MSRIVLTWELGSNLGHLARLLPLAICLKSRGHSPLLVTRDLGMAAKVFAEAGIPFIQAPVAMMVAHPTQQAESYAEILWNQGWADRTQLWGLVQGWANLFRMFRPEVALLDHSPTALLAARITATPTALIGTGFELPPTENPIPRFPHSEVSGVRILEAERRALANANWVLSAMKLRPMSALGELFDAGRRYLTTFPELDHYGPRLNEHYVGPIGELAGGEHMLWPPASNYRIFVYLRPGTTANRIILRALRSTEAAVLCFIPGAAADLVETFSTDHFKISSRPIQLAGLLDSADLCVSYAPAGTVTSALLKGVPHLMIPQHPEAELTAQRVTAMGAGLTTSGAQTESEIAHLLQRLLGESAFKARAGEFAQKYHDFDAARAVDLIVEQIEQFGPHSSKPEVTKTNVA
jgi:UDP:flavonoid glycosyltransferase YjiC (YdhE family)